MPPQEKVVQPQSETVDNTVVLSLPMAYTNPAFISDSDNNNEDLKNEKKVEETLEKCEKSTPFEFDDLLPYIGEFGLYQIILFLLMIPFAFSVAFVYFTQIFITVIPDEHWCWVPELANLSIEQR
ncbi:hypothetical protein WA026_020891 [Henosepilachna vigintioctopunctata]|uniref:Carcinine transporter-like n=1 Tax=Henosepilachna vigintioctopunctata TaxID=420089 RepID=A0AAW1UNN6_9CUCU